MPYNKVLNEMIIGAAVSIKEIAERCAEHGVSITASYISALKNDEKRTPSDEVSRALAIACGYDEDTLVVEAYYDNAPEEFKTIINALRDEIFPSIFSMLEATEGKAMVESVTKQLQEMPTAKFIRLVASEMDALKVGSDQQIPTEASGMPSISVQDDSMAPLMPKGTAVITQAMELEQYKSGDILCYKKIAADEMFVRTVSFLNEEHTRLTALPMNHSFDAECLELNDIVIIGKVAAMVVPFQ